MDISIDEVFNFTKQIEAELASKFGADGRGLHEKATHAQEYLDTNLLKKVRKIASVRNKLAHEVDYKIPSNIDFENLCQSVLAEIRSISVSESKKYLYELEVFKFGPPPLSPFSYFKNWVLDSWFWCFSCFYWFLYCVYLILRQQVSKTELLFVSIFYILAFIYRGYEELKEYENLKVKYNDSKKNPVETYTFERSRFQKYSAIDTETKYVDYSSIKKVELREGVNLVILNFDRGVTETSVINLADCQMPPKYICQKIYSIVFDIPI